MDPVLQRDDREESFHNQFKNGDMDRDLKL
jgi:hypothetical protein